MPHVQFCLLELRQISTQATHVFPGRLATKFNIYGTMLKKFLLKPVNQFKANISLMIIGWTYTKAMFFVLILNSRWPPSGNVVLTQDPMGKCNNFFSETSKPIQSKHCLNDHWMDFYKSYVFCADRKFKMADIKLIVLTWDPIYRKMLTKFIFL